MNPPDQRFRELAIAWDEKRREREKQERAIQTAESLRSSAAVELARLEKDLATFVGRNVPRKIAVVDERSGVMVAMAPEPSSNVFVMRIDVVMPEKPSR
jgi:stage III sporulation protein SpoIIIAA